MHRRLTNMRAFVFILFMLLSGPLIAQSNFTGYWRINLPETDKLIVKLKDGSGMKSSGFRPSISVMGLPMPSSYRQSAMSRLPAKDPQVLRCTDMAISIADTEVALKYDVEYSEILKKGDYRGRTSKWSKRKIEQKYKTPERSVRKTWTLRADGRLLVSVKINPRDDRAQTYSRVFDRVDAPAGGNEPADES